MENKYFKKNEKYKTDIFESTKIRPQLPKKYAPPIRLTQHTPKARFKQYRNERTDAYHSYDIIIDNIPAGNGGTRQWNEIMVDYNLSNISLVNNHQLQYELIRDINKNIIKTPEDLEIIDLYGITFIIPKFIQNELNLPPSHCNLYYDKDKSLFKLKSKGYAPAGWCDGLCQHCDECIHKDLFNTAWYTARATVYGVHEPVLWIPPKAYNNNALEIKTGFETELEARGLAEPKKPINLINNILTKFNKSNLFYDENLINYIYNESALADWQLNRFKKFISTQIIEFDEHNKIYELWMSLIPLVDCIINNIQLTSIENEIKINNLKKEIKKFTENWKSKDLKMWCDTVMFLMYKHKVSINISNPMYKLYNIIGDMFKNRNNAESPKNIMFGRNNEGEGSNFSYYFDQSDTIRDNIKNSNKFIFRSGFQRVEEFWNILFPEFEDYIILKTPDKNSYLKSYHRYTRGAYPKYVVYNIDFRTSFYKLAKVCKEIVDYPTIRKQKILIIIFQKGIKELIKKYFPKIRYPDLFFEYWYNLEGQNTYIDCTGVILFGCAGKPSQVSKIMSDMYGFPLGLINNYFIKGEMSQGIGRIRPNLFPNTKWCIALTNVLPNGITDYINFNRPEDIVLLPFLRKKSATAEQILDEIYLNKIDIRNVQRKLKKMCDSRILKRERENNRKPYIYKPYKKL